MGFIWLVVPKENAIAWEVIYALNYLPQRSQKQESRMGKIPGSSYNYELNQTNVDFGPPCLPWCESSVGCSTADKPGLGQGLLN